MTYSMDTALARNLATTMEAASTAADEQVTAGFEALAIAELFADAPGELIGLSEAFHRAGVIIDQQIDLLEGFELDLFTFADALSVDPDVIAQQLDAIDELGLGAEGLLPLLQWDANFAVPTDLRDVFIGLPEPGENPELDAAIERLNGFLLALLLEPEMRQVTLTEQQEADLRLLGTALGGDALTFTITRREQVRDNGDTEWRDVDYTLTYVEAGGQHLLDWLFDTFTEDAALNQLGAIPDVEEIAIIWYERLLAEQKLRIEAARDDEGRDRYSGPRLPPLEYFLEEVAKLDSLDGFLVPALLGRAPLPDDPEALADLLAFVELFGETIPDADDALRFLQQQRFLQDVVVDGDPTGGEVLFDDLFIDGTVAFGIQTGAIPPEVFTDANALADFVLSLAIEDLENPGDITLDSDAIALDPGLLVQAVFARVPEGFFTENQLFAAIAYIQSASTVGEQRERLAKALLAFHTANTVGVPTFTRRQWDQILGRKISKQVGNRFDISSDSEGFRFIVDHFGVPGYHKLKLSKRIKLHLAVDGDGSVADFVVEKKPSWMKAAIGIALTVVGVFFTPAAVIAAAYNAQLAANAGDDLGVLLSLVGAFSAFATVAGWSNVAKATSIATSGVRAYRAFDEGDILEGIGYTLFALGEGADFFGVSAETVDGIDAGAKILVGVDQTIESIEADDLIGAVQGIFVAGSGVVRGIDAGTRTPTSSSTSAVPEPTTLQRIATSVDDLGRVAVAGARAVDAGLNGDDLAAISNSLVAAAAGAAAFANNDGYLSGAFDISTGTRISLAELEDLSEAAGLVAGGIRAAEDGNYFSLLAQLGEAAAIIANDPTSLFGRSSDAIRHIAELTDILVNVDPRTANVDEIARRIATGIDGLIAAFTPPPDFDVAAEAALLDAEAEAIALADLPKIRVEELPPLPGANPPIPQARPDDLVPTADPTDPSDPVPPGFDTAAGSYQLLVDVAGDVIESRLAALPPGGFVEIAISPVPESARTVGGDGPIVLQGDANVSITAAKDLDGTVRITVSQGDTLGVSSPGGVVRGSGGVDFSYTIEIDPPDGTNFTTFPNLLDPLSDPDFTEGTVLTITPSAELAARLAVGPSVTTTGRGDFLFFDLEDTTVAGASAGVGIDFGYTALSSVSIERTADTFLVTKTFTNQTELGADGQLQVELPLIQVTAGASLAGQEAESRVVVTEFDAASFDSAGYFEALLGGVGPSSIEEDLFTEGVGGDASFELRIGTDNVNVGLRRTVTFTFTDSKVSVVTLPDGSQSVEFERTANGVSLDGTSAVDGSDATFRLTFDDTTITLTQADLELLANRPPQTTIPELLGPERFPEYQAAVDAGNDRLARAISRDLNQRISIGLFEYSNIRDFAVDSLTSPNTAAPVGLP